MIDGLKFLGLMMPGGKKLMGACGISMMKPETRFFYDIVRTAVEKRYCTIVRKIWLLL